MTRYREVRSRAPFTSNPSRLEDGTGPGGTRPLPVVDARGEENGPVSRTNGSTDSSGMRRPSGRAVAAGAVGVAATAAVVAGVLMGDREPTSGTVTDGRPGTSDTYETKSPGTTGVPAPNTRFPKPTVGDDAFDDEAEPLPSATKGPETSKTQSPQTAVPQEPGTTSVVPQEPGTTDVIPEEPGTTSVVPQEPGTTGVVPQEPGTTSAVPQEPTSRIPVEPTTLAPFEPDTQPLPESGTTATKEPGTGTSIPSGKISGSAATPGQSGAAGPGVAPPPTTTTTTTPVPTPGSANSARAVDTFELDGEVASESTAAGTGQTSARTEAAMLKLDGWTVPGDEERFD